MLESKRRSSANIKFDEDINLENVDCDILRVLLTRYSSLLVGDTDYDTDIYLYDRRGFMTFDYGSQPLYPRIEKREDYDQFETEDMVPFVSLLRCIYTIPMFRKTGYQKSIFSELIELSEATGRGFTAHASPFRLNESRYEKSGLDAMLVMIEKGYSECRDFDLAKKKQRERFESYGLKNFWHQGSESESEDWFVYMPSSAPEDHKKTIGTLLRD